MTWPNGFKIQVHNPSIPLSQITFHRSCSQGGIFFPAASRTKLGRKDSMLSSWIAMIMASLKHRLPSTIVFLCCNVVTTTYLGRINPIDAARGVAKTVRLKSCFTFIPYGGASFIKEKIGNGLF